MRTAKTILIAFLLLPHASLSFSGSLGTKSSLPQYIVDYIKSPSADPSCAVCVKAADSNLASLKDALLKERTAKMVYFPEGEHTIGADPGKGEIDEQPKHAVKLGAFYIDAYETTINEYKEFVKSTRSQQPEWLLPGGKFNIDTGKDAYYRRMESQLRNCSDCPIVGVNWDDASAYCAWKKKRLPTEAEWETAAKAGADTKFHFGDSEDLIDEYSWNINNSDEVIHPVGRKKPNKAGLYDMHGNVWEWVYDFYGKDYYKASPKRNPRGPETGKDHIIRGGSWAFEPDSLSLTNRGNYSKPNDDIGFRCAASEKDILKDVNATGK